MNEQSEPMRGEQAVLPVAIREFCRVTQLQARKGDTKYGHPLETFNGRDAGRDAWEELVDLAQYLMQMRLEREALGRKFADAQAEIVQHYETALKERTAELESARADLVYVKNDRDATTVARDHAQAKVENLTGRVKYLEQRLADTETALSATREKLRGSSTPANDETAALEQQIRTMTEWLRREKSARYETENKCSELLDRCETLRLTVRNQVKELENARSSVAFLKEHNRTAGDRYMELFRRFQDLEQRLASLTPPPGEMGREAALKELSETSNKLLASEELVAHLQEETTRLRGVCTAKYNEVMDLRRLRDAEIKRLTDDRDTQVAGLLGAEARIKELETQVWAAREIVKTRDAKIADLGKKYDESLAEVAMLRHEVRTLSSQLADARSKYVDMRDKYEVVNDQLTARREMCVNAEKAVADARGQHSACLAKNVELGSENVLLRKEIATLTLKVASLQTQVQAQEFTRAMVNAGRVAREAREGYERARGEAAKGDCESAGQDGPQE